VVHIEQPWRKGRSLGDLTIRWIRRSRALAAESWGGIDVPLVEEREAYEVEIMEAAAVKRTLASGTTSVTYTGAQQIADWGALLGPDDRLNVRVYQLSALVGRGAPAAAMLRL
jgi:hypothetical protein